MPTLLFNLDPPPANTQPRRTRTFLKHAPLISTRLVRKPNLKKSTAPALKPSVLPSVSGQKLDKKKPARISSETVVLGPGDSTGWRRHRIPVYVHVLAGTYTVDFGEGALVEYPAGTAFIQATKTDYKGTNTHEEDVSVLHVYLGAKGLRDIIER